MSQSGSLRTSGGGGGGIIETIAGDTGTPITGANVTIFADNASNSAGATVLFDNGGTTSTFKVSDSDNNTFIGGLAGNLTTTSTENTAFGVGALNSVTTSSTNVALGRGALTSLTGPFGGGGANTVIGWTACNGLLTGTDNIVIGAAAGSALATNETGNIIIGNAGIVGDNRTIRIGLTSGGGAALKNFQGGITGITAVGSPVAVKSDGQLSDLGFGTSGQVLTSNGAGVSPTWQGSFTGFRAYLNANTATNLTGDATLVIVPFDTVDYDTATAYNTGTSTYTIPTTGYWQTNYTVFTYRTAGANTTEYLNLLLNGATAYRSYEVDFENVQIGGELILTSSHQNHFTSGDTIQVQCLVNGAGKNIGFAGTYCVFSAFLIG